MMGPSAGRTDEPPRNEGSAERIIGKARLKGIPLPTGQVWGN